MRKFLVTTSLALALMPAIVVAQGSITIAPGPLGSALNELGLAGGITILAPSSLVQGKTTLGVNGAGTVQEALGVLLRGSGLSWSQVSSDVITVTGPQAATQGENLPSDPNMLGTIVLTGTDMQGFHAGSSALGAGFDAALRDVPQSVSVVGRGELRERQAMGVSSALEGVPNVNETSVSGNRGETFNLRGFRGASYSIDGVPMNPAASRPEVMMDMSNVERVEVLKGPASVLYGQGEPGGTINVVTRAPSDVPETELSMVGGSFGLATLEGTTTGALNESGTLVGRLSGSAFTEDGFRKGRPTSKRQSLTAALDWRPTDQTKLSLGLEHAWMDQPFDKGVQVMNDNRVLEPYDAWLSEPWSMIEAERTRATLAAEHHFSPNLTLRGRITADRGRVYDTGIDNDGVEERADGTVWIKRRYHDRHENTDSISAHAGLEYRFNTGSIDHVLLTGVQFTKGLQDFHSLRATVDPINAYDPVQGAPMPSATTVNSDTEKHIYSRAVFLQDLITLSPQWKIMFGLRYDDYSAANISHLNGVTSTNGEGRLSGRIGVVWQPSHDLALYFSASQSFKPQSGIGRNNATLEAETGEQYEIGGKWDISPSLSANVALFQITRANVSASDTQNPGMGWSVLTGQERARGLELELVGEITPQWNLRGSIGLLDGEVTRDASYEGNKLRSIPETTASLWTSYAFDNGWTLGGGAFHVGERAGDAANSFFADGYTRLDTMASYRINDQTAISVSLRNVTDKSYIASTSGRIESHAGAPRTLIAKLDYRF